MAIGCNNLVRILVFEDGSRWIARLRLPSIDSDETAEVKSALLQREIDCMRLVKERTSVPVPAVLGYDTSAENAIGAPSMLMEYIPGNVAVDLQQDGVPPAHQSSFYVEMARLQAGLSQFLPCQSRRLIGLDRDFFHNLSQDWIYHPTRGWNVRHRSSPRARWTFQHRNRIPRSMGKGSTVWQPEVGSGSNLWRGQ